MVDFLFLINEHPIVTALVVFFLFTIYMGEKSNKLKDAQRKDNLYGPVRGYTGRQIDRQAKERKNGNIYLLMFVALIIFIVYILFS